MTRFALAIAALMGAAASLQPGYRRPPQPLQYRMPTNRWTDGKDRERIEAAQAKRERKAAKLRGKS